ncbi:MAG: Outer membrane efflux protein BepC [Alphaproteobacteria bacterium MarineAlpha4_Bin2]|nr:MAG: Outer membrane efflux protein BepC [Alphaproteobacteria bacterium MarineAlpha4_Bin2]
MKITSLVRHVISCGLSKIYVTRLPWAFCLVGGLLGVFVNTVAAQTLEDALSNAYLTNPGLLAARAELRARDETVNQAISNWRPNVEFATSAGLNRFDVQTNSSDSRGLLNPKSVEISIEQNIYRGGQTPSEIEQREAEIKAKRSELREVEQDVLLDAAKAYMNVVRDQAVVDLQKNSEKVLLRQLEATQDRFSVGEVTRTDVSQAEARVARAKADRIQAEGSLENTKTNFERVIGLKPTELKRPELKYLLPESLEGAITTAAKKNPSVTSSFYWEKAAQKKVLKIKGELLPEFSLEGNIRKSEDETSRGSSREDASIIATLTIPLYQQGAVMSRVREAKQQVAQRRLQYDDVRRLVIEATRTAWENLETARARIEAFEVEIKSSDIALEGVRQEANVGSRTVLDVLDAEQELLDAQVNLVRAQRDEFVAATELAAAVGNLSSKGYNLKVDYYDETIHYNKVRDKFYGLGK